MNITLSAHTLANPSTDKQHKMQKNTYIYGPNIRKGCPTTPCRIAPGEKIRCLQFPQMHKKRKLHVHAYSNKSTIASPS